MPRRFNARLTLPHKLAFGVFRGAHALGLGSAMSKRVVAFFPKLVAKMEATLEDYEPSERDVFVCAYPKGGNNWLMQLAVQTAHKGAAEFDHIHDLVAWPHFALQELLVEIGSPQHESAPTGLRIIKNQMTRRATPFDERAHYLAVVRDPKDVIVSIFHFVNGILGGLVDAQITLDQVCDFFLAGRFGVCWAEHAHGWWELRERDNVLFLRFAEMRADLPGTVSRIAEQLDVQLRPEEQAAVIERSSFAWMKAREELFAPTVPTYRGDDVAMIRKGLVGESRQALRPEQRSALDDYYRRRLAELGSDLPYDDWFADDRT